MSDVEIEVEILGTHRQRLGEAPLWCAQTATLYWVDIKSNRIHGMQPFAAGAPGEQQWELPTSPSALALRNDNTLAVATRNGLGYFDPATGEYRPVQTLETGREGNRSNEGRCDPRGRYWIGTMDDAEQDASGALYRVDADLGVTRVLDDIGIPNTFIWTPDGAQMLFADTVRGAIYRYDYDAQHGRLANRRLFAEVPEGSGAPDGSTLDSDGCVWTAIFGGSRLIRWTPDGRVEREIALPVRQPTSCIFGGPGLDTLFVTSASKGLDEDLLAREPHNGKLLALHAPAGARGLPEPLFAG